MHGEAERPVVPWHAPWWRFTVVSVGHHFRIGMRCRSEWKWCVEYLSRGLIVGLDYYIRVDGVNSTTGTFQLCINNFNPPALPGQDCKTAGVLCDKSPFVVQKVSGGGMDIDEANNSCLGIMEIQLQNPLLYGLPGRQPLAVL